MCDTVDQEINHLLVGIDSDEQATFYIWHVSAKIENSGYIQALLHLSSILIGWTFWLTIRFSTNVEPYV